MSHLKTEFDTIYTPDGEFADTWHGLQTCIGEAIKPDGTNVPNAFVPMLESRFTLRDIDASRLLTGKVNEDDETKESKDNPLDNWKMILADHPRGLFPVHVPKAGYVIHQNKSLFDSFVKAAEQVLGKDGFTIATIGTLGGCSQFFVSVSIKGQDSFKIGKGKKGDLQKLFFNLVSSHNGIVSSAIMLAIIRIVCMNTVLASLADAESTGRQSKFKHTAKSLELITPTSMEKSLQAWIKSAETYRAAMESFTAVSMTVDGFKAFASGVFTNKASDELSTTSFNRVEDMVELFQRGKGNSGVTLYDGINAFTEYFTTGRGVGGKDVDKGKRLASANFGQGNAWKQTAINLASTEESFNATLKRGETLYSDKLKANAATN